jgi:ketosteroid isomerase-like protein
MDTVDTEALKKEVEHAHREAFAAEDRKDLNMLLGFFSDDVIIHSSNKYINGINAVRELFERFLPTIESMSGEPTHVEVSSSGELGWDRGHTEVKYRRPEGVITEKRKYFAVWEKIDGNWKCVALSAIRVDP